MRFKFISYVDQPGTPFLGVATLRGDPTTGEIIAGDANVGGPALDGWRTSALQAIDLVSGRLTDREIFSGEETRAYFDTLGSAQEPNRPREDFSAADRIGAIDTEAARAAMREIDHRMAETASRAGHLSGADVREDRMASLRGTEIEARLTATPELLAGSGFGEIPSSLASGARFLEPLLDRVSPLRVGAVDRLHHMNDLERRAADVGYDFPTEYTDDSIALYAADHADWGRAKLEFVLNRHLFRQTETHEVGHCFGLRHDFGGTADDKNYADDFYAIAGRADLQLPDPAGFDRDGVPGLDTNERVAFQEAYRGRKLQRKASGLSSWSNASIMDYPASWYQRDQGIGRYDRAAIAFGYGDLAEVYDNQGATPLAEIHGGNTPRVEVKYYAGGESCAVDADCPYSASGERRSALLPGNASAGLVQRCVDARLPRPGDVRARVCSNFDRDAEALVSIGDATSRPTYAPVQYKFCSDERVGTLAWCNRWDEGESYREIVENVIAAYDRGYIFANFRRYRANFGVRDYLSGTIHGRYFFILNNIVQDLVYRYVSDPAYRTATGPFGFYDHFLATADIFNFYARVLAQPDVRGYRYNEIWNRYDASGPELAVHDPAAHIGVPVGTGRYWQSIYQSGLTGMDRLERVGSITDKMAALEMLSARGVGAQYGRDVPLYVSLFDLFPRETEQLFGGLIRNAPEAYMPRVQCGSSGRPGSIFPSCASPRVVYMDFYRGDCSGAPGAICRPDPSTNAYRTTRDPGTPKVLMGMAGWSGFLRMYAAIYALARFPVFSDTRFERQLFVCVEGQAACNAPDASAVLGRDYARHTSERLGQSFIAFRVTSPTGGAPPASIGFDMVKEAADRSAALRIVRKFRGDFAGPRGARLSRTNLEAGDEARLTELGFSLPADGDPSAAETTDALVTAIDQRVQEHESFFSELIQLEQVLGVSGYLRF